MIAQRRSTAAAASATRARAGHVAAPLRRRSRLSAAQRHDSVAIDAAAAATAAVSRPSNVAAAAATASTATTAAAASTAAATSAATFVLSAAAALAALAAAPPPALAGAPETFAMKCAGCHMNGGNVLQAGATLSSEDLQRNGRSTPEALYEIIYGGKGKMPGFGADCAPKGACTFGARLADEEVREQAEYVLARAAEGWKP